MVDVEADGPCPGEYSMVSFGAVIVEPGLNRTFYGQLKPVSDLWIPGALAVSGHSREETLLFPEPELAMKDFDRWLRQNLQQGPTDISVRFISDNNGFDWQFINYYFHRFLKQNPFGFSSTNLGSLYKGMQKNMFVNFKKLRKTKHTHHPVSDAIGNAEAFLYMQEKMGLRTEKKKKR
jgi:hypothetical protein